MNFGRGGVILLQLGISPFHELLIVWLHLLHWFSLSEVAGCTMVVPDIIGYGDVVVSCSNSKYSTGGYVASRRSNQVEDHFSGVADPVGISGNAFGNRV